MLHAQKSAVVAFRNRIIKPSLPIRNHAESLMPFLFSAESPFKGTIDGMFCESREVTDNKKNIHIHYEYYSRNEESGKQNTRPLVAFVHGGAWKFGNSRQNYQLPLLKYLLGNGVDVISCNYRKDMWPIPLNDVAATFENIQENYGGDGRKIVFFGSSAGGHLAIMAYYYALIAQQIQGAKVIQEDKNHKMLLFYPAIDVFNQLKQRQMLFPPDRNLEGTKTPPVTLLSSFFETFVTPRNKKDAKYPWVSPVELIEKAPLETWSKWPSTLVVHGKQDMITLFKGSEYFIESIKFFSGNDDKHELIGVDGSHNFDIPDCPTTKKVYSQVLEWIKKE
jgi:hypothetical protein